MIARKIILFGASGFLGTHLTRWLREQGAEVRTVSRNPSTTPDTIHWDGEHLGDWVNALNGADAVINLCGHTVNCRYHAANRRAIRASRLTTTTLLAQAIGRCVLPPRVWLNASSATIYRDARDRPMTEVDGELGEGFSVRVCQDWEAAFFQPKLPSTRRVALRTSLVLGEGENSVYPTLRRLVRLGLGGRMGDGGQKVSWLHLDDFCRAVGFLLTHELAGPVNLTAPEPLENHTWMRQLRKSLDCPRGLPNPAWTLALGAIFLRTEPELILKSRWVLPERLRAAGFTFLYPTAEEAFAQLAAPVAAPYSRQVLIS